jgi:ACS family hexuronate transporter-like MFS transporter
MGIINAGTSVGAVAAPPLIAIMLYLFNWRSVFFVTGAFGLLWTIWWMRGYFAPAIHPRVSQAEREELADPASEAGGDGPTISWIGLFAYPQTWGLVIGKFLSDAAWYFYLFWLPKYLYDARGFDIKQVGYFAWIPYAAAGVGALLGGWWSSHLLSRGHSLNFSRKVVLGASAALMPLIIFVTSSPIELTIVLFSIAFFGQQSWSTLVMILPTDLFPRRVVASVAGLVGFGGAMGGVVFNLVAGRMLDAGSGYGPVFAAVSTFHVLAFLLILVTVRKVKPVDIRPAGVLAQGA